MDKQSAIRGVCIAVTVCFGILTSAPLVLWVRSYTKQQLLELLFYSTAYMADDNGLRLSSNGPEP